MVASRVRSASCCLHSNPCKPGARTSSSSSPSQILPSNIDSFHIPKPDNKALQVRSKSAGVNCNPGHFAQSNPRPCRFFAQYDACNVVAKGAWQFCTDLRSRFDDDRFPGATAVRQKLLNYCVATIYLGFGWLPHYKQNNLHVWVFNLVHEKQLLSAEEEAEILGMPEGARPVFAVRVLGFGVLDSMALNS
jgi:hypothetical protein